MATKEQSSKLTLEYRGGKIQFGLHKPTDQYRKKHKGKTLYLGSSPDGVLDQWLEKTSQHDDELVNTIAQQPIEEMTVERLCNQFWRLRPCIASIAGMNATKKYDAHEAGLARAN